jgi:alanine dehydrogenase
MRIGIPKEIKDQEFRVGLVPGGARRLIDEGHEILIERSAGEGSGIPDEAYSEEGAGIVERDEVWENAELVVKVKEPQPSEWPLIRKDQILFTFFHLASSRDLTEALMNSGAVCIAYETVQTDEGHHPLLTPMSEIAGRLAVLQGAKYLERTTGGRGLLLSGVPGVHSAHVVILGAGTVGISAAKVATGLEARVTILDINLDRLRYVEDVLPANVSTLFSSPTNIREMLGIADIVIGGAHLSGAKAPYLVFKSDLKYLREGTVLVDAAIDQGGCFESSSPTTHSDPTYVLDGIVHYCVANMPGCVPRTSTYALTNATTPYISKIAKLGFPEVLKQEEPLRLGTNIMKGKITFQAVAEAHGLEYTRIDSLI